jgi:hypothetical protein
MSQKWSRPPQTMPADFPYVWVSGLHLWQAPRTARSTGRFGVRGVTCTTCPNVTDRNRMSQKWSHRPQTMPADFPYVLVSGLHLWRSPRTARSTRHFGGWGGHVQCCAPPAPKLAVAEGVQRAPNHASWLFIRCGKQAAP